MEIKKLLPSEKELESIFDELWPICRSITGQGIRDSFQILNKIIPLEIRTLHSGRQVFDWTIPKEWNIWDAYILDPNGSRIVDFKNNNLHILNYSIPIETEVELDELQNHLYSLEDQPDAIPYVTSYYKERWGFCVTHNQRQSLKLGKYKVVIKTSLQAGVLNYGHLVVPSTTGNKKEVLISSYLCHPSMANNELSGPILVAFLYQALIKLEHREYNYRFVIVPETIGSICFLSEFGEQLKENCIAGLVATCVGDKFNYNYKRSKRGDSIIDKICENLFSHIDHNSVKIRDFFPTGSDERQYCSPGFNLPIGSITRSLYGEFKEYHTSLDNKDFIDISSLKESLELYLKAVLSLENNHKFVNTNPNCEPMLGKRGLYNTIGASKDMAQRQRAFMYLLSYSDGSLDLVDIANKSDMSCYDLIEYCKELIDCGLLIKSQPF